MGVAGVGVGTGSGLDGLGTYSMSCLRLRWHCQVQQGEAKDQRRPVHDNAEGATHIVCALGWGQGVEQSLHDAVVHEFWMPQKCCHPQCFTTETKRMQMIG